MRTMSSQNPKVTLRPATQSDAAELSRVQEAAWKTAYSDIFPGSFLDALHVPESRWAERMSAGVGVLVSTERDRIVGYSSYAAADDPGWGELRAIYVDPDFQGRGHGSRLLEATEAAIDYRGYESALLWVIDRNTSARNFYEHRGWTLGAPFRLEDIGGTQVTLVRYETRLRSGSEQPRRLPDR